MTWAKLDDRANEHHKILAAGAEAAWFWTCGLMYANRQKARDGFIPDAAIRMLYGPVRNPNKLAAKLVEVGLWERVGVESASSREQVGVESASSRSGFRIRNYTKWNASRDRVDAESSASRRRAAESYSRKKSRSSDDSAPAESPAEIPQTETVEQNLCGDSSGSTPTPTPTPYQIEKKREAPAAPAPAAPRKEKPEREVFAHWLSRYREIHPRALERDPDPKTELKPIAEALRRGFTADDLRTAIDGMFADEWNRGANDRQREYLDVHVAMKSANTERFRLAGLELRDASPARRATYRREIPTAEELANVDPVAVKARIATALEAWRDSQREELPLLAGEEPDAAAWPASGTADAPKTTTGTSETPIARPGATS